MTQAPIPFEPRGPKVDRMSWLVNVPQIQRVGGVIHGALPNKSNSRKHVMINSGRGGKRPMYIKSEEARFFESQVEAAATFLESSPSLPLDGVGDLAGVKRRDPVLVFVAVVYVDNLRRDLDVELLPDCLEKAGVIKNDRGLWWKLYRRRIDRERPRVEFRLTRTIVFDELDVVRQEFEELLK